MGIIRVNPFRALEHYKRNIDRNLNWFDEADYCSHANFVPKIDISEDENNIIISAEVPGIAKEDIEVKVNDENVLVIKGEKKSEFCTHKEKEQEDVKTVKEKEEGGLEYFRAERSYGKFSRSFMLPDNADGEKIKAKHNNGVLELVIAKKEPDKPKEISVKIE